jgi:hypothetical protein
MRMNLLRTIAVAAASAMLVGCATDEPQARAKTSQLREGMSQGQVKRIFGQPDKVDHDDGYHHGYGIPYYGWHGRGGGEEEVTWEYRNPKLEVTFRRGSGGWVVKEWDN